MNLEFAIDLKYLWLLIDIFFVILFFKQKNYIFLNVAVASLIDTILASMIFLPLYNHHDAIYLWYTAWMWTGVFFTLQIVLFSVYWLGITKRLIIYLVVITLIGLLGWLRFIERHYFDTEFVMLFYQNTYLWSIVCIAILTLEAFNPEKKIFYPYKKIST
ncbi:hypothetical protein [Kangiella sp. TOML190]|uniref:hypothetical protein n=1 Tax=Kangiella sp. TOML190 TaxID=2931351 RepID=UPI00203B8FA0|nr:hypothetical protein [Kangiella sp. TOML190]